MTSPAPLDAVCQLEAALLQLPQADIGTWHLVHGGLSARTILIPAGTALTGALTNIDNVCIVSGDITVTTDEGAKRLTGFHVVPALAGSKRVGFAHADTWWTTMHCTDLTNVADIEDEMTSEAASLGTRCALPATEHFKEIQ